MSFTFILKNLCLDYLSHKVLRALTMLASDKMFHQTPIKTSLTKFTNCVLEEKSNWLS